MRLRRKRSALPELQKDSKVIFIPSEYKGRWKEVFGSDKPIHLELGCGRGTFISRLAEQNPDINYIAVDKYSEVLVNVLRKINATQCQNVRIIQIDIDKIDECFDREEIDRLYINFCNPWPSRKHHKRRLTYPSFLRKYRSFLKPGAEVWFKTDDDGLFKDSLNYFKEEGFEELYRTYDLHQPQNQPDDHAKPWTDQNIITEYETKYMAQNIPIKFAVFRSLGGLENHDQAAD